MSASSQSWAGTPSGAVREPSGAPDQTPGAVTSPGEQAEPIGPASGVDARQGGPQAAAREAPAARPVA